MSLLNSAFDTPLFTEVWSSEEEFVNDVRDSRVDVKISNENLILTYYLLYSAYGNTAIRYTDTMQFKYALFVNIFKFGPTWESRLDIQEKIRALTEEDLIKGGKAIYNSAVNPSQEQSTATLEELTTLNGQNTTTYKKSKIEAYQLKWDMLARDVTTDYVNTFSKLFLNILSDTNPVLFGTEVEK